MKIDAHHHFWQLSRAVDYPWLSPSNATLYRDYRPEHLRPLLARHGIGGTILVQASPTLSETQALLTQAQDLDFVKGVVGWCEFTDAAAPQLITELARSPWLRGLRPMVQDIQNDDWLLRDDLAPAFEAMVGLGLVFDALVHPRHLTRVAALAERHAGLRIVVDHAAKPAIHAGNLGAWHRDIALVATRPETVCKLSGLVTECGEDRSLARLRPVVDRLLHCFGPDRLMWGSDWPVVNLSGGYDEWVELSHELLSDLSSAERDAIFGATAERVYLSAVDPARGDRAARTPTSDRT